jgi:hypothetical protein
MFFRDVYDALQRQGIGGTGGCIGYFMTSSGNIIELYILNKIVIKVRSGRIPLEEVAALMQRGEVTHTSFTPTTLASHSAEPEALAMIFPVMAGPFFDAGSALDKTNFLRLLGYLGELTQEAAGKAFYAMLNKTEECCAGFSIDREVLRKRSLEIENRYGFALTPLHLGHLPSNPGQSLQWILSRPLSGDELMDAELLSCLFFNEPVTSILGGTVYRERAAGAEAGFVRVAVPQECPVSSPSFVNLYNGINFWKRAKIGAVEKKRAELRPDEAGLAKAEARSMSSGEAAFDINLFPARQKRPGIPKISDDGDRRKRSGEAMRNGVDVYFSPTDFSRLGLNDGYRVNLIFASAR